MGIKILKKAQPKDSKLLLSIRNQPAIRKNSFFSEKIKIEDHSKWFDKFYKNKKNYIYIIYSSSKKVGYIRYKNIFDNIYEISIALKRKFHNKNLGSLALAESEKLFKKNAIILSKIKKNNKISLKFFEKNLFSLLETNNLNMIYYKIINNNFKKNYEDLIKSIESSRKKNNLNWMELLKLVFLISPNQGKKIFRKIAKIDKEINNFSSKLIN